MICTIVLLIHSIPVYATDKGIDDSSPERSETVLYGSVNNGNEGLTLKTGLDYAYGPDSIAVVNHNDIYVLDGGKRIQHYLDGCYANTILLPSSEEYYLLRLWNQNLIILGRNSLNVVNIYSGELNSLSFPITDFGPFINDIVVQEGHLILSSEQYGNYEYDFLNNSIKKTNISYCISRIGGLGGKTVVLTDNATKWNIPADNRWVYPLGFSKQDTLYILTTDAAEEKSKWGYCRIAELNSSGTTLRESIIDVANTAYSPRQPATVGLDGIVYLLEVYETEFFINAISVGENIYCKKASKDHTASVCRNSSLVENETVTRDAQNVTVSRSSAASRALSMINYNWTFSNGHNRWAEYSATAPAYLASASVPSAQTGIPYAWGRFNGYTNLGGNNASFSAAAAIVDPYDSSKRLYAAGNCVAAGVTNNKAIGLDCSGYASSAYGFTEKAGTYHFATSAYFTTIQSNNLMRMDALVKSGSHMEFFVTVTNSAAGTIQVYECCTANGKTIINYPNLGTLTGSGYVCRRPTSWANCVHTNVNPTYLYDSVNHWKKCKFCEGAVNVTPHTFVYVGSNYQCSVCGYISGTTPRDLDTIEESH